MLAASGEISLYCEGRELSDTIAVTSKDGIAIKTAAAGKNRRRKAISSALTRALLPCGLGASAFFVTATGVPLCVSGLVGCVPDCSACPFGLEGACRKWPRVKG